MKTSSQQPEAFAEYVRCELSSPRFEARAREIFTELNGNWDLSRALVMIETGNEESVFANEPHLAYELGFEVPGYTPPAVEW